MGGTSPFAILQEFDQRCRANARGLPAGEVVEDDWVGIGFSLTGKHLLAKMSDIIEILPPPTTIRVPGVKPWLCGIANVRGSLLPIIDMGVYLNGKATKKRKESRVLIINKQNVMAGLLVEEVAGMRRFKPDVKKDTMLPEMAELQPYLDGVFSDGQVEWSVFSVEKLVTHERFLRVVV
jgi:twitching motility protein PilI